MEGGGADEDRNGEDGGMVSTEGRTLEDGQPHWSRGNGGSWEGLVGRMLGGGGVGGNMGLGFCRDGWRRVWRMERKEVEERVMEDGQDGWMKDWKAVSKLGPWGWGIWMDGIRGIVMDRGDWGVREGMGDGRLSDLSEEEVGVIKGEKGRGRGGIKSGGGTGGEEGLGGDWGEDSWGEEGRWGEGLNGRYRREGIGGGWKQGRGYGLEELKRGVGMVDLEEGNLIPNSPPKGGTGDEGSSTCLGMEMGRMLGKHE
ncbi:hypothetical protein Tco_1043264 [Tanacetum coccineum]|uniref:Uncharacterized protein n=1 Tax=Tanacetum coccineum TaxID=301880 RepID=A0ABQ5GM40_9ASTR